MGIIIAAIVIYYIVLIVTMKINVKKVVQIFEEKNALSVKTAISATKLNIRKQSFAERSLTRRDYRFNALKLLLDGGVVIITADNSYYLDKKKMSAFRKKLNFFARTMIPNIDN